MTSAIFEPLQFRSLRLENRVLRSSVSGRFDNYDGSGTRARINWELKFARGGVGAIISSWCGVDQRGFIVPNYAAIDHDGTIPFWRELGERVHEHDCKYILQLAHGGRQRDIRGLDLDRKGLSSTGKPDPLHGFEAEAATPAQLRDVVDSFAAGARRARAAGLDGVEIHGANGYLFTQFLSSAINARRDEYGGTLENRARLLLETVRAVRAEVGDFHLQVKISATENAGAFLPWIRRGNTLEESVQVCRWLEQAGVDAIHVSAGSTFPHPDNPAGGLPLTEVVRNYDSMISSGVHAFRNYLLFRLWPINRIMRHRWQRPARAVEGSLLADAAAIKRAVSIPVLCTGGFQTASVIERAIRDGACDAVTIARPLVANNDLVRLFAEGVDAPPNPCSYCNKCLFNVLESPLGCYDERRFGSREEMVRELYSVYDPPPFVTAPGT